MGKIRRVWMGALEIARTVTRETDKGRERDIKILERGQVSFGE